MGENTCEQRRQSLMSPPTLLPRRTQNPAVFAIVRNEYKDSGRFGQDLSRQCHYRRFQMRAVTKDVLFLVDDKHHRLLYNLFPHQPRATRYN